MYTKKIFKPSFAPAVGRISKSGSNSRLNKGLYDFAKAFFKCGRPLGLLKYNDKN
jgi:hypothetical protein